MARVTAPLFGLDASGTIADALTYARWKGINYVRTRVVPTNPNTLPQQEVRGIFATLSEMWKAMPQNARYPFQLAVRGVPMTDRNKHVQLNVAVLKDQANLDNLVMSVATGNAVPLLNVVTADGADGTATITADAPPLPPNYRLLAVRGVAVLDGDPSPVLTRITYYDTDETPPYSFAIDVPADGVYQIGVFGYWHNDADGLRYCSIADRSQVTVTGN